MTVTKSRLMAFGPSVQSELYLLQYHRKHLEYLQYLQLRVHQPAQMLSPASLLPFSIPYTSASGAASSVEAGTQGGYNNTSITHDLIMDVYAQFCVQTRQRESEAYMRMLSGTQAYQSPCLRF